MAGSDEHKLPPYFTSAKTRKWTDAEVLAAISHIQKSNRSLWDDIVKTESTTGDFSKTDTYSKCMTILFGLYPPSDYTLEMVSSLFVEIRTHIEKSLGIDSGRFAGKIPSPKK